MDSRATLAFELTIGGNDFDQAYNKMHSNHIVHTVEIAEVLPIGLSQAKSAAHPQTLRKYRLLIDK